MKRKFLAFLLAFVMIVGMLPMAALAEEPVDAGQTETNPAAPVENGAADNTEAGGGSDAGQTDTTEGETGTQAGEKMTAESLATAVGADGTGDVTLDGDIALSGELQIARNVIIDLGTHKLTTVAADGDDGIWVKANLEVTIKNGTLEINGASEASYIFGIIASEGSKLTLQNVTLTASANSASAGTASTAVYTSGALTLTDTTINAGTGVTLAGEKAASVAITGGKITANGTEGSDAGIFSNGGVDGKRQSVTFNSGEIDSKSYGIAVRDYTDVVIKGGTIKGTYGITTNGTDRHTDITMSAGTVTGTDAGIYAAAPVSAKISGGKVTGPIGILCRGCALTVTEAATIEATGDNSGTVGDDATQIPPAAVVLHQAGGGYAAGSVNITGGTINAKTGKDAVALLPEGADATKFVITNGTFSSNPFAESTKVTAPKGYEAKANADNTAWTIAEKKPVTVSGVTFSIPTNVTLGSDTKLVDKAVATLTPDADSVIKVTGLTAEYITGWTAFNDTEVSEQNGNYLPLKITLPEGTTKDKIAEVKVIGSKTKTWTNNGTSFDFFTEDGNQSETLIMQLNKLVGNEGEEEGKTGMKDGHFQIVITPKADVGEIAQATTYDIDCTGVILKLPAAPKGDVDETTGESKLEFADEDARKQEAANVTNIINAVKAPNKTDDKTAEGVDTTQSAATIAYTATTEGTETKTGTVTLPNEVTKALQQKDELGNDASDKIDVKVNVVTDAATVTLSTEAIGKLSSSADTVVKVEPKEPSSLTTSDVTDTNSQDLLAHLGDGVDVTIKEGTGNTDLIGSDKQLSNAGALVITMKVQATTGEVHILYLNETTKKFELMGTYTVKDGYVTFKAKHLCQFYEVASTAETNELVNKLGSSSSVAKTVELAITGSSALRTATVTNLDENGKCTVQVCREANAAPAVIFVLDANASGTATFQVNAGSVVTVWKGVLTFDSATGNPNNAEDVEHVTETAQ